MDKNKIVLIQGGVPRALSDGFQNRFTYNILPLGKFYDSRYGKIEITRDLIEQMESNFGKALVYEVPVKLGHDDGAQSPGRVVDAKATDRGLEITMDVDDETAAAIRKKRYRYMSAEFTEKYSDKKTGADIGAVLYGAALVNQPGHPFVSPLVFIDDIDPYGEKKIIKKKEQEEKKMEKEALDILQKQLKDVQDDAAKAKKDYDKNLSDLSKQLEEVKKLADDLKAENNALEADRDRAERERHVTEVKAFCDNWSGKGVPPSVLEIVRPALLSEARTIKLSDTDSVSLTKLLGDVFEAMPRVPMGQMGTSGRELELSDTDRAKKLGEQIAVGVMGTSRKSA